MAQKYTASVVRKEKISPNVYLVTFKLQTPETLAFKAGQCMMLMCAPGVNRTMSIASTPHDSNEITMIHDISPMGPGSKWTIGLSIGDSATLLAPTGAFTMDMASTRKKVFVATGTGIAPFGSMIQDYLESGGTAPLELYWGLRFEEDMFWQNLFNGFAAKYPNFVWHQVLSRPTGTWSGLTGHVTEHVVNLKQDLPSCDYYLCGNKKMVDDVRTQLLAQNVPATQIKSELFY